METPMSSSHSPVPLDLLHSTKIPEIMLVPEVP